MVANTALWSLPAASAGGKVHSVTRPRNSFQHRVTCGASASASPETPACCPPEEAVLAKAEAVPSPIFPGGSLASEVAARAELDALIEELEGSSPEPAPLEEGAARARLVGRWRLVYASGGTAVTASALGATLRVLSALPFVGLEDVEQELADGGGGITTSNAAVFGLGPLGSWRVVLYGRWEVETASVAEVTFDKYSVQMVKLLGVPVPAAKIVLPAPRREAAFTTKYLSDRVRVSRGRSGNIFLFVKQTEQL